MKKRLGLYLVLLISIVFNIGYVYALDSNLFLEIDPVSIIQNRLHGAITTISIVVILWIILAILLLKSEPKVKNVNMADRYKEVSLEELNKFGIDTKEFKKIIYNKFKEIHIALNNMDMDLLKRNLTDDLYRAYVIELNNLNKRNRKIVTKDFELVNFKVYNILESYGLLHIDIYLNVRMIDYVIDMDNNKCISGNDIEKMDFEYELNFVKKMDTDNKSDYLLSKKSCINKMEIQRFEK